MSKITVAVPQELLDKAQRISGQGITDTVRAGLRQMVESAAYARLRRFRGTVEFSRSWVELKDDR